MTRHQQISAHEVVEALLAVITQEQIVLVDQISREVGGTLALDSGPRLEAQIRLTEVLDAWHRQSGWYIPTTQDSPFDRARRDPLFATLVEHLYQLMREGEGQWTPTEVREAAIVAQVTLERARPMRFVYDAAGDTVAPAEPPDAPKENP